MKTFVNNYVNKDILYPQHLPPINFATAKVINVPISKARQALTEFVPVEDRVVNYEGLHELNGEFTKIKLWEEAGEFLMKLGP